MMAIALRFLRDKWVSLLIYSIASIGMMWMYVAMFPSILAQSESYSKLAEAFPEAMLKAFGIDSFVLDSIEKFLSLEHLSMVWPLMIILLSVAFAGNAIAREIDKGTIEHLLARPVSRMKIFFGRYIAGLLALVVFVVLSMYAIIPIAAIHDISYLLSHFSTAVFLGLLFGWAIFSAAMMLSSFFSDKGKVAMLIGGLLILMYVLNIISGIKENLQNLQYLSFFHYFATNDALVKNVIGTESIIVFAGAAIVCTIIGAWRFIRRDIAV